MVDAGEEVSLTLVREFCEEAMNSEGAADTDKAAMEATIRKSFNKGLEVRGSSWYFKANGYISTLIKMYMTGNLLSQMYHVCSVTDRVYIY